MSDLTQPVSASPHAHPFPRAPHHPRDHIIIISSISTIGNIIRSIDITIIIIMSPLSPPPAAATAPPPPR